MKEIQLFLILSPAIILIFAFSFLISKLINKTNKKLKKYPAYQLTLFLGGIVIMILALINGTNYPTLLIGIAASTSATFLKYKKLKNKP